MKKFIVITLVLLGAVQSTFAQDEQPQKIGIRAGYHSSIVAVDGSQVASTEALNSFYLGVFKEKKLAPLFRFGTGLEYFKNGFDSKLFDMQKELHYISAPLYLKVKVGPLYATGGTALNFKVAENTKIGDSSMEPISEKSNWFDMPLQAGVGIKILMFSLEARYNWGLLELNDEEAKNQYFQLGLALSL